MSNVTNGLSTLSLASTPPLTPGQRYYLGVENPWCMPVTVAFEVDFDITTLTNLVPVTGASGGIYATRYFQYDVSTNATAVSFVLTNLSGNVDLVARKGPPLPTLTSFDYLSANPGVTPEAILVRTNSIPVPVSSGRWYLGVINTNGSAVTYTILVTE
jgi:hypothetical protein